MLSNTSKYAIRAMIYLGQQTSEGSKVGIKKISEELDIPSPFLGKILQTLAKRRLLISTKGPNGGFAINKKLEEITVLDIVEIIDGLDFFNNCLLGLDCHKNHDEDYECALHEKYEPISNQLKELFQKQTIDTFVDDIENSDKTIKL